MKKLYRTIHLYLGLACGLVIAVVCFTGATLVFEKELEGMIYPERRHVPVGAERVAVETMMAAVKARAPRGKVTMVKVYGDRERPVEIGYRLGGEKGENSRAFVDPYTGRVIALSGARGPFFATMFSLHRWLLAGDVGKRIVGVSTLVFLVILITGIILWWPRTMRFLRQRLVPKLTTGWKRTNHDLHVVIGFWTALPLFICAFTGLAWSFTWFNDGIYTVTGSPLKPPPPPRSVAVEGAKPIELDRALALAAARMPGAESYTIAPASKPTDAIRVTVMPADAPHERASHQIFVDRYSGAELALRRYEQQSLGQRARSIFYPIHVGSIAGLPGRIIALVACVAGFTFPFTGVILWINRLRRKRAKGAGTQPAEARPSRIRRVPRRPERPRAEAHG